MAWSTADTTVIRVDAKGVVKPLKAGLGTVKATLNPSLKAVSAKVEVRQDIPVLTVASKSGAPVNVIITFSPRVHQEYGNITLFKWDLDGNAAWDDSLAGPWFGETVNLPALSQKYVKEGAISARFMVRDSEGNEATVVVPLDIGNQAPEIIALRTDTLISIKDSIPMTATVRDVDGKVALVGWDYDGDGKLDDSLAVTDTVVKVAFGRSFPNSGKFSSILIARDSNGKTRMDSVLVTVVLDPPVADAGDDITVQVGSQVASRPREPTSSAPSPGAR